MQVFVYGTLKPGEINYQYYCQGHVTEAIEAYTYGTLFDLPGCGYPAMTEGNNKIKGFLLTFTDDSFLVQLDELEDYDPRRLITENEYYRQKIGVYTLGGEYLEEAWGYLMTAEKIQQLGGVVVPSGCWNQHQ